MHTTRRIREIVVEFAVLSIIGAGVVMHAMAIGETMTVELVAVEIAEARLSVSVLLIL